MLQAKSLFSKNRSVYLGAFFTPVILLFVIMLCAEVFPLGDNCILKTDMYHQYAPFFSEYREKLQNGGSLNFTWDLGLGVNFAAIIAYYLASPFNLLIYFVNENYTIEFMSVMIVLKAGLSALCMAVYLKNRAPMENFGAYIFSLFYALSGYYCAYYWNIMWLDSIAVFPLVMLGAERIIEGKSGVLYGAALGYSIFCNYYVSIPVCMFLILYFFAYGILKGFDGAGGFIRTGLRFALWSLLAGGIAAAMLLPEIYALSATVSSESVFPRSFTEYFGIFDMVSRHMAGVKTEQWLKHYPNIYCGGAVYLLFGIYLMTKRISIKEKALYIFLAVFMLAGFSINVLNFIWHGFRYPNSLPARQSFIYCLLVVLMCFRVYENRHAISKREIGTSFIAACAFIILAQKLNDNEEIKFGVFYAALLITSLHAGLLHIYRKGMISGKNAAITLTVLVIAELAANTAYTSFTVTSRSAYTKDNDTIRTLVDKVRAEDDGLYRFERISRKTKDDGAWLNFPSVSIFSSMANADCSDFFKAVGCEASTNAYSITGSTPLMNMLFGVKYAIYGSEQKHNAYNGETAENSDAVNDSDSPDAPLILTAHDEDVWIYENRCTLPVGYVLPGAVPDKWMTDLDDPILVQNSLCDALSVGQVLVPVQTGSESGGTYTVTLSEAGEYYAYAANADADTVTFSRSTSKKSYEHLDRGYLMELGYCRSGELLTFTSDDGSPMDLRLYRFDYGVLSDIYDKMSQQVLDVTEHADGYIRGNVHVDARALGYSSGKAYMLISTPYDEGWSVKLDGEPVELYKGLDTFLGFYIPDGDHELELSYEPQGSKAGIMISAVCIAVLLITGSVGIVIRKNKIITKNFHEENKE